jgi:two-component system CheB/CheR fusion protein
MAQHAVVVIGASAGGLQAITAILERLPASLPACVLVVVHSSSNGQGVLPQVLTRSSKLPVAFARQGDLMVPGRVYVAPPDPPFSRLDLIVCRNVLIYMDLLLRKKLLSVFHYALNANGFLVLGQAETVGAQATLFSLVDKKFRIHRKRPITGTPAMSFPVDYSSVSPARKAPAPPEGLLYGLRSAMHAARKSRAPVRRTGQQVREGKRWTRVDLEIIPLASTGRVHYLVLFEQPRAGAIRAAKADAPVVAARTGRAGKSQVVLLERELAASREYLQSVIQELEAANEELQSANEEILSSNEELQGTNEELDTAKEELQSTNEELNTVNEELQGRNEELSRVNSDLLNLLGSVQIAIVIVGSDMRIRRFTPMAERVLNLIPADVDRSIGHINPNLEGANLEQLIAECIDSISPVERKVRDRDGRWYSLRVRPYRSAENKIDGAVLALFDIDAPKRFEASVRSASDLAEALLQTSTMPMVLLDSALLRLRHDGLQGRLLSDVVETSSALGACGRDGRRPPCTCRRLAETAACRGAARLSGTSVSGWHVRPVRAAHGTATAIYRV